MRLAAHYNCPYLEAMLNHVTKNVTGIGATNPETLLVGKYMEAHLPYIVFIGSFCQGMVLGWWLRYRIPDSRIRFIAMPLGVSGSSIALMIWVLGSSFIGSLWIGFAIGFFLQPVGGFFKARKHGLHCSCHLSTSPFSIDEDAD